MATKKSGASRATRRGRAPSKKAPRAATAKRSPAKKATATRVPAKKALSKKIKRSEAKSEKQSVMSKSGLGVGAQVPPFSLQDQDGATFDSKSLAGEPYVLYFYPKDDTPGCTREACGFRDELGKFRGLGVRVVGVSPDKPESHRRFREKYGLSFTLLSDAEKSLARTFGVWVMKKNYGREYMGIERSTFLVDASGKIKTVWRAVRVDGHVASVLAAAG